MTQPLGIPYAQAVPGGRICPLCNLYVADTAAKDFESGSPDAYAAHYATAHRPVTPYEAAVANGDWAKAHQLRTASGPCFDCGHPAMAHIDIYDALTIGVPDYDNPLWTTLTCHQRMWCSLCLAGVAASPLPPTDGAVDD